jgi:serine phosphatase RsbU (regulator of sigma subunit)
MVTLMDGGSTVNAGAHAGGGGGAMGASTFRERVERVQERELAAITQNRLQLLIDVAAGIAGCVDEASLGSTIVRAAAKGTGYPRALLLRDDASPTPPGVAPNAGAGAGVDTLRIVGEVGPDSGPGAQAVLSASRSLIQAARAGEVARLTADAPVQAQSIMSLGIHTALCAPVTLGAGVAGFLYLDARAGEGKTGVTAAVQADAAAFCSALAKMAGLALGNLARADLERRQRELVRDLEAAREAQRLIMPPDGALVGRVRYAMKSRSGRYVAGDLLDVVDLGDDRVAVVLGDVAGKGVPAAILMATAQTHLHVSLRSSRDAAAAVSAVNRHICDHIASNKFISLWVGVFDARAGTLTYVDAGHGHWLLLPKAGPVRRVSAAGGFPLGIDGSAEYAAETLPFAPGDRLVVFSDGVVEQPGAATPDLFGLDRAVAALEGNADPAEDVERLFNAVVAFAGTDNLADDTTVASVCLD